MNITKTTVNASSRPLGTTWSTTEPKAPEIDPRIIKNTMVSAMRRYFLQEHGVRVAVYKGDHREPREWCHENATAQWDWSPEERLSSEYLFRCQLAKMNGEKVNEDAEFAWSNALAREQNREAALESGMTLPRWHFWFEDANEAMLFKLTWGGM